MAIQVRKFRDMPLHDTFQKAYEEYESMVNSFIQPCLSINTEAFGSEFKDLLDYQRVFDACAVQACNPNAHCAKTVNPTRNTTLHCASHVC